MPASIFAGSKVKTLKSTLSLNGGADVISSTVDPTAVAVDASPGSLLLNTTTGKQYRKTDSGSSTNWTEVGSGTSGINYISNPSAATNTTGWATYADAAGTAPVDGTGGSPTVTWTRSTTTPLRGAADFNFTTPGGGSVQGQGVSTDFTIDLADQAKVLTVTFDYEVVSGTYASGDLTCYLIADPTGTPVVIQPAGYVVQAATVGTKMRQIATFQTQATGQTYRLCFHVASTSASAYVLAVDNVSVGPQVVQYGAPVTDWQSYTPQGSWTSNTTYTGRWRRVGDSMELQIRAALSGSPNASGLSVNIPTGYAIDTTKLTGTTGNDALPNASGSAVVGNTYSAPVIPIYLNTVSIMLRTYQQRSTDDIQADNITNLVPGTFISGDFVEVGCSVPILGWSSTVQMSNDTDTRVVAARVFKTANQGPFSAETKLTGYTVDKDPCGMWDSLNNRFNVLIP